MHTASPGASVEGGGKRKRSKEEKKPSPVSRLSGGGGTQLGPSWSQRFMIGWMTKLYLCSKAGGLSTCEFCLVHRLLLLAKRGRQDVFPKGLQQLRLVHNERPGQRGHWGRLSGIHIAPPTALEESQLKGQKADVFSRATSELSRCHRPHRNRLVTSQ